MIKRPILTVVFGIVGPIVCVLLDPCVFRYDATNSPLGISSAYLGAYQPFGYAAIFVGVVLLALHLAGYPERPVGQMVIAGSLFAASAFALVLGSVLLPYSVIGLAAIIGIFGFTPFVSAWVYATCAFETLTAAARISRIRWVPVLAGFVLFFGVPVIFHFIALRSYTHALGVIDSTDSRSRAEALTVIRRWDYLFGHQRLIAAFQHAQNEGTRNGVAEIYHTITGHDLGEDLRRAND